MDGVLNLVRLAAPFCDFDLKREENPWVASDAAVISTMSKKSVVAQADLRKLMQKVKTGGNTASASTSRKYKLSSREQQLIEEQKRIKEQKRAAKAAVSAAKAPPPLPQGFFDAKPAKSILKNSSAAAPYKQASPAPSAPAASSVPPPTAKTPSSTATKRTSEKSSTASSSSAKKPRQESSTPPEEGEEGTALPEGFFDDPKQDAKVRENENSHQSHVIKNLLFFVPYRPATKSTKIPPRRSGRSSRRRSLRRSTRRKSW